MYPYIYICVLFSSCWHVFHTSQTWQKQGTQLHHHWGENSNPTNTSLWPRGICCFDPSSLSISSFLQHRCQLFLRSGSVRMRGFILGRYALDIYIYLIIYIVYIYIVYIYTVVGGTCLCFGNIFRFRIHLILVIYCTWIHCSDPSLKAIFLRQVRSYYLYVKLKGI